MRLFLAVWPSEEARQVLADLPRPPVPGLRWASPEQWHVTLRFLGAVGDPELDAVRAALATLTVPPTEAALGTTLARLGRTAVCLPVSGLDELGTAVVAATAGLGKDPGDRPFHGHLTVARAKGRVPAEVLAVAVAPARWRVAEISLVESVLGRGGASYRQVAAFPLTG